MTEDRYVSLSRNKRGQFQPLMTSQAKSALAKFTEKMSRNNGVYVTNPRGEKGRFMPLMTPQAKERVQEYKNFWNPVQIMNFLKRNQAELNYFIRKFDQEKTIEKFRERKRDLAQQIIVRNQSTLVQNGMESTQVLEMIQNLFEEDTPIFKENLKYTRVNGETLEKILEILKRDHLSTKGHFGHGRIFDADYSILGDHEGHGGEGHGSGLLGTLLELAGAGLGGYGAYKIYRSFRGAKIPNLEPPRPRSLGAAATPEALTGPDAYMGDGLPYNTTNNKLKYGITPPKSLMPTTPGLIGGIASLIFKRISPLIPFLTPNTSISDKHEKALLKQQRDYLAKGGHLTSSPQDQEKENQRMDIKHLDLTERQKKQVKDAGYDPDKVSDDPDLRQELYKKGIMTLPNPWAGLNDEQIDNRYMEKPAVPYLGPESSSSGIQLSNKTTGDNNMATKVPDKQYPSVPYQAGDILKDLGISQAQYDAFRGSVSGIESHGKYDIMGGSSGKYAGKYQLGPEEIKETAAKLGMPAPSQSDFLKNPELQEKFFEAYTDSHHKWLMAHSPEYAKASPEKKLEILGYAHNQGAGGAAKWLATGQVGHDAFGTGGDAYTKAIAASLAKLSATQVQEAQNKATEAPQTTQPVPANPVTGNAIDAANKINGSLKQEASNQPPIVVNAPSNNVQGNQTPSVQQPINVRNDEPVFLQSLKDDWKDA